MLLKLLEDKNGEVQNLAVKWFVEISVEMVFLSSQIKNLQKCFILFYFHDIIRQQLFFFLLQCIHVVVSNLFLAYSSEMKTTQTNEWQEVGFLTKLNQMIIFLEEMVTKLGIYVTNQLKAK